MPGERSYDTIIVGLGAWGGAAAYRLARRGRRVLGLDRYAPPHPHGSSHGRSRMIRQATPEGRGYAPLMVRAFELWDELSTLTGTSLVRRLGGVFVGRPDSLAIAGSLASYADDGTPHEVLAPQEAARRFATFRIEPDEVMVFEPGGGVLNPEECVSAHLRAAGSSGAELRTSERVESWEADGGGVKVVTSAGLYEAESLVLAAGPWAPELLRLELRLAVERQVVAWLAGPVPEGMPVFILPCEPPAEVFYGMPEPDGTLKIALHHGGLRGNPDTLPRVVGEGDLAALERASAARLTGVPPDHVAAVTCLYTNSPDGHFIVGRHPESDRVVLATGDSGRGFKLSTAIGEILADLANGLPRPDADFLSPARLL